VTPVTPPLTNSREIHKARSLALPVRGDFGLPGSLAVTVSAFFNFVYTVFVAVILITAAAVPILDIALGQS